MSGDLADPLVLVGAGSDSVARPFGPPEEPSALLLEALGREANGLLG